MIGFDPHHAGTPPASLPLVELPPDDAPEEPEDEPLDAELAGEEPAVVVDAADEDAEGAPELHPARAAERPTDNAKTAPIARRCM